ncbi:MAG TPA: PC4/YdbC family ssDNA-binding protein [Pseudogracilibacillus sp.]|nr:PC4/YdbC family ssDNA-binding protein [Pseudogracilibacillus sp.]
MASIQFDIIQTVKVLSEGNKGWKKELNIISWNGRQAKYDIRDWSEDHQKMGKGVTFTSEELEELKIALEDVPALD